MGSSKPDNSSQLAQTAANQSAQRFIEQQARQARSDVNQLLPEAIGAQRQGFQQGLDVLGQTIPLQQQQFQQGNIAAQQAAIDAQPGIEAALLGGLRAPENTNPTQPFAADIDTSFANQQLPLAQSIQDALPQTTQIPGGSITRFPGGSGFGVQGDRAELGADPSAIANALSRRLGNTQQQQFDFRSFLGGV